MFNVGTETGQITECVYCGKICDKNNTQTNSFPVDFIITFNDIPNLDSECVDDK